MRAELIKVLAESVLHAFATYEHRTDREKSATFNDVCGPRDLTQEENNAVREWVYQGITISVNEPVVETVVPVTAEPLESCPGPEDSAVSQALHASFLQGKAYTRFLRSLDFSSWSSGQQELFDRLVTDFQLRRA